MTRNYNHMSYSDREDLLKYVTGGCSLRRIGKILNKSASTLSRELKMNCFCQKHSSFNQDRRCAHYKNCMMRSRSCTLTCSNFEKEICPRLQKAPWICAGCQNNTTCRKSRTVYSPKKAQSRYEELLVSSRKGPYVDNDTLMRINDTLTVYMKQKKQSLYHISKHNELGISSSSIYRYIEKQYLPDIRNIDLPKKSRYRKRIANTLPTVKEDRRVQYNGRTYADYLTYMQKNCHAKAAQMDSVEGPHGHSVLLTIHLIDSHFMMAFKRPCNDSKSVLDTLQRLKKELDLDYYQLFTVLLPDRGSEFIHPEQIEQPEPPHRIKTHVFYCDPRRSDQKGSCEKNHEFIRDFVKQGKSFDDLSQDEITEMMNNINSVKRKSLGGKCPFECLSKKQKKILKKLGYTEVPADEVILSSKLFTKNK